VLGQFVLVGGACLAAVACGAPEPDGPPRIRLEIPPDNPEAAYVEVTGLSPGDADALRDAALSDEAWATLLRVSVEGDVADVAEAASAAGGAGAAVGNRPAMLGSHDLEGRTLRFTPRFPFDAGRRYEVVYDPSRLPPGTVETDAARLRAVVSRPRLVTTPTTHVTVVYPSGDLLPENQLRMYVHFSGPMGRRGGLEFIHLLDDGGEEVPGPFLPLDADFWNDDRTRYTVFFDPGRVKKGLTPRVEMGPSLEAGREYTLVVDAEWLDGDGLPLREAFRRTFRVGPADERPLDPGAWRVAPPPAGAREPVVVTFPEPLDHGLLLRAMGIAGDGGVPIDGHVVVEAEETRWLFTPTEPWPGGAYQLVVLSILEDLAGNRIGRAFEVDQFDEVDRTNEPEVTRIPFRIAPTSR
jgi:hypothetical protein